MRIIAGSARGRPLQGPRGAKEIRPTADRVRETLFNILGQWMEGLFVLDLYAGTGALALEALSRGAARAVLVDSGREAQRLLRANAAALGFSERCEVYALPVERALEKLGQERRRFDLVFADPPYAARAVSELLERLWAAALLAPGGRLAIEHDRREEAPERVGELVRYDQRRFGDTLISLYAAA
ncbi:MAG: 16S rRNA (guanine(966)-N(2))-methyltransferase RsmD [Myxococcota bacterium]